MTPSAMAPSAMLPSSIPPSAIAPQLCPPQSLPRHAPTALPLQLCLAIDDVYSWGANELGQLGHGDRIERTVPSPVRRLSVHLALTLNPNLCAASRCTLCDMSFPFTFTAK